MLKTPLQIFTTCSILFKHHFIPTIIKTYSDLHSYSELGQTGNNPVARGHLYIYQLRGRR